MVAEEDLLEHIVGVMAAAELGVGQAVNHGPVPFHGGYRVHSAPSSCFGDGERSIRNTLQTGKMLRVPDNF